MNANNVDDKAESVPPWRLSEWHKKYAEPLANAHDGAETFRRLFWVIGSLIAVVIHGHLERGLLLPFIPLLVTSIIGGLVGASAALGIIRNSGLIQLSDWFERISKRSQPGVLLTVGFWAIVIIIIWLPALAAGTLAAEYSASWFSPYSSFASVLAALS